ncbi:hypothetical protein WUBG_14657, partial [Wuchereria bancrofti]
VVLQQKPPDNESQWNLRIRASDAGWPFPRSNEVLISMYVSGTNAPPKRKPSFLRKLQNEHSPVFMKQTVFVVSVDTPPGKVVGQIESHDDDMGYAGLIRFGTFDKFFALEPFTGEVILLVPLGELLRNKNKKKQMEYIFEITACDWGQPVRCTNGTVTVLITEANVYRPRFEKPYYRVHIAEDTAIGTKFLAVLAQDNDYGDKGQVGYQIIDSQNHFQIDENTGILQVMKKLDREEMAFH